MDPVDPNKTTADAGKSSDGIWQQVPQHDSPTITERPGEFVSAYKLLSVLGEGTFGTVWLAERREPFVQRVALKIMKPGMDSREVLARFEQERQALAMMDHPNIAKIYDAGATPHGRPYFVMEHVQGEPITAFCDRHAYTIRQRLKLFIPVCEAVQHAHTKGVIHRDLKPSNILASPGGEQPIPKVIDFGMAKALGRALTDKTIFTEHGQMIGTPEYMSPEQAEMGPLDVDTRTDVYALGVVLYQLLTGLLPFDPVDLRSKGKAEMQRIIRELEPPTPSERLTRCDPHLSARIAHDRNVQIRRLRGELKRELQWIPMMAMRKDRARRYATPLDMARDLASFLENRPLAAGKDSDWYRLRKYLPKGFVTVTQAFAGTGLLMLSVGLLGRTLSTPVRDACLVQGFGMAVALPLKAWFAQVAARMVARVELSFAWAYLLGIGAGLLVNIWALAGRGFMAAASKKGIADAEGSAVIQMAVLGYFLVLVWLVALVLLLWLRFRVSFWRAVLTALTIEAIDMVMFIPSVLIIGGLR